MTNDIQLTASEQERARRQAIKTFRESLELTKPVPEHYAASDSRAGMLITSMLVWAKVFVPIIALLAVLASSVRTIQTASEIYSAAGSHPFGVAIAAIAFTIAVEGALFALALARQNHEMRCRAENAPRHVATLRSFWHGILVRIGVREPLRYNEIAQGDGLGIVMLIAFLFAVASNAYMGFRPLLAEIGAASLQEFVANLWTASAKLQLTFIVDVAGILFPPLMALAAGHLTARFAAEIAGEMQSMKDTYQRDLAAWREAYTNPLDTDDGKALLNHYLGDKIKTKIAQKAQKNGQVQDFLSVVPPAVGD